MAETHTDSFKCQICLNLLEDPVTLPCGHNYCLSCIKDYWDQEDGKGVYSCPQCRKAFQSRPAFIKNCLIAEMVETMKKVGLHGVVQSQCPGGLRRESDSNTEKKVKDNEERSQVGRAEQMDKVSDKEKHRFSLPVVAVLNLLHVLSHRNKQNLILICVS